MEKDVTETTLITSNANEPLGNPEAPEVVKPSKIDTTAFDPQVADAPSTFMTLEEMRAAQLKKIDEMNTPRTSRMSGMQFGDTETSKRMDAQNETVMESLTRAFRSTNAGAGIYQYVKRKYGNELDENFSLRDHWDELDMKNIPIEYWDDFSDVGSLNEAMQVKAQINQELNDKEVLSMQGFQGMAAIAAAGLFDVDAPIMFMSGGLGSAAKATRLGTMVNAAVKTGVSAAGVEAINAAVRPTHGIQDVLQAAAFGTALGGLGGAFVKPKYRTALEDQVEEMGSPLSMGAMHNPNAPIYTSFNPQNYKTVDELIDASTQWNRNSGFSYKLGWVDEGIKGMADKFSAMVGKIPGLSTDYDRLARSTSKVANWFAYEGLESAAGKIRNNQTMANMRELYHKQISSLAIPEYASAFREWTQANKVNLWNHVWQGEHADNFGKMVMNEMMNRRFSQVATEALDPAVKRAADALEAAGKRAFEIGRGVGDEIPIHGFADIKYKRGYFPLKWRGDKIKKMMAQFGEDKVHGVLARAYKQSLGLTDDAYALKLAKAVTRRAMSKEDGFDMNVQNLLTADGREYLKQALMDNNVVEKEADQIINALGGKLEERGQAGFTKARTDIDLRYNEDGVNLMDMVETDMQRLFSKYSRELSGKAAMARKGIASRADFTRIKEAIKREDPTIDDSLMDGIHSYFGGGPLAGGVDPYVRRAMQLTNLSLLNGLGLTQVAETGAMIAASGWESFIRTAPSIIKEAVANPNAASKNGILKELRPLLGNVGDEHLLFRDDYALDIHRGFTGEESKWLQTLDHALANGQRLQGYLSYFYNVRQMQQRIAVTSMADKVMRALRDNDSTFITRMGDIGMSEDLQKYLKQQVKAGTVEFAPDGALNKLGLDKWNPDMADEFALAMNRHTDQVLQRAMAGESSVWMHKDVGAVFMHLKSFPILAIQKQLARNARLMDNAAAMTFLYGLGTAGLAYTAKEAISGKGSDSKLSPLDIAKGAFNMSNMTGWIPMWTDPLAEMLGMNSLKFNSYGNRGASEGILSLPPVVPTINRMAHLPGAVLHTLTGNMTNDDLYALQATPIIGNLYGFNAMFNALKN